MLTSLVAPTSSENDQYDDHWRFGVGRGYSRRRFDGDIENSYACSTRSTCIAAATLHGAAESRCRRWVSTLAISCVFTSVIFLEGPAKYLFTPLGLAVVFGAMLASYGLSRTLTPDHDWGPSAESQAASIRGSAGTPFRPFPRLVRAALQQLRDATRPARVLLTRRISCRPPLSWCFTLGVVMFVLRRSCFLSGDRRRHDPAPRPRAAALASEKTEQIFQAVETRSARSSKKDLNLIVDNSGSGTLVHWAFSDAH